MARKQSRHSKKSSFSVGSLFGSSKSRHHKAEHAALSPRGKRVSDEQILDKAERKRTHDSQKTVEKRSFFKGKKKVQAQEKPERPSVKVIPRPQMPSRTTPRDIPHVQPQSQSQPQPKPQAPAAVHPVPKAEEAPHASSVSSRPIGDALDRLDGAGIRQPKTEQHQTKTAAEKAQADLRPSPAQQPKAPPRLQAPTTKRALPAPKKKRLHDRFRNKKVSRPHKDQTSERTANKKRATRKNKTITAVIVAAVVIVATLVGVVWYMQYVEKADARESVNKILDSVASVDHTVASVDGMVNSKTTTETAGDSSDVRKEVEPAIEKLREDRIKLSKYEEKLSNSDQPLAAALHQAINGRIDMLTDANRILLLDEDASKALTLTDDAWNLILKADAQSKSAVAAANKQTKDATAASQRSNATAKNDLAVAKTKLEEAKKLFPSADLAPYISYVDLKLAQNSYALQSDAAILAGDIPKANSLIGQYNTAEKNAAAAAKKLPGTPQEAIKKAYEAKTAALLADYQEAKTQTAKSDQEVRKLTW